MERTAGTVADKEAPLASPPAQRSACWPQSSLLRLSVLVVLATVTVGVLGFVWQFTLTRFFTLDEYQWGHATWLIHEGKVPYRDFYEHHLPLGYTFHSLFYSDTSSFTDNALTLRKIAFAYKSEAKRS